MSYSVCKVKNLSGSTGTWCGQEIADDAIYTIQDIDRLRWAADDDVLTDIGSGDLEVHNSIGAIIGVSDQIDWLKDNTPIEAITEFTSRYSKKGIAVSASCATNTTTKITIKVENFTGESYTYKYLWGGELFGDNIEYGDYARMAITDEDNVLGYGAGTEIKSYIEKAYLKPAPCPNHFSAQCPGKIPVSLYLTCWYTATSVGSTRNIFINYDIDNKD